MTLSELEYQVFRQSQQLRMQQLIELQWQRDAAMARLTETVDEIRRRVARPWYLRWLELFDD